MIDDKIEYPWDNKALCPTFCGIFQDLLEESKKVQSAEDINRIQAKIEQLEYPYYSLCPTRASPLYPVNMAFSEKTIFQMLLSSVAHNIPRSHPFYESEETRKSEEFYWEANNFHNRLTLFRNNR